MPNWAEGTLKIKGKREDILKFCQERLNEKANSGSYSNDKERSVMWDLDISEYGGSLIATTYNDPNLCIWIRNSLRNFIDMDTDVPYYWSMDREEVSENEYIYESTFHFYAMSKKADEKREYCIVFPFKGAWGVEEEYYARLSEEYPLEFRIYTVEQGIGFFSEFSAKDGKITEIGGGPKIEKEDGRETWYGQFVWQCPIPFIGG